MKTINGRRDAEVDEVGEAVELGAEPGLRLERARQPAVDAVEQGGDDDEGDGQLVARSIAMRIAVRPAHRLSSVKKFGTSMRTGIWLWRNRAGAGGGAPRPRASAASDPCDILALAVVRAATARAPRAPAPSDLRSASTVSPPTARWPTATKRRAARRQVDIDARAEADQAEALADADAVALARRTSRCGARSARRSARRRSRSPSRVVDDERAALVLLARLVDGGVEEAARHVDRAHDAARRPARG